MNLLRFDFNSKIPCVYLNNINIKEFLKIFNSLDKIKILEVYEIDDEPYLNNKFMQFTEVFQLIRFFEGYHGKLINALNFECGKYKIEINDLHEYTIYSNANELSSLLNTILFKLFQIHDDKTKAIIYYLEHKYIVIQNSKVIDTFDSFEGFMSSEYNF